MTSEMPLDSVSLDGEPSTYLNRSKDGVDGQEIPDDLEQDTPNPESMHGASTEGAPVHQASEYPLPPPPPQSIEIERLPPTSHAFSTPHQTSESTSSLQDIPLDPPPPPPVPKSPAEKSVQIVNGSNYMESSNASLPQPPDLAKSVQTPPPRSASISSIVSMHHRSLTMSRGNTLSVVLITSALDTIAASREAKRSLALRDSTQRALEMIRAGQGGDRPRDIFEPLKLACETRNEKLMIASLDCISKLISHSFFVESLPPSQQYSSPPESPGGAPLSSASLPDLVSHTITSAYTETTPDPVSLQIVKALLALVLSPTILVHHSSLLKAVRTVYNVFLLSQDPVNQMVAQGGLTQMVNHVFTRCQVGETPGSRMNGHSDSIDSSLSKDAPKNLPSSERRSSLAYSAPENDPISPFTPSQETPNGTTIQFATKLTELDPDQVSAMEDSIANESTKNAIDVTNKEDDNTPSQSDVPHEVRDEAPDDGKVLPPKNTITL